MGMRYDSPEKMLLDAQYVIEVLTKVSEEDRQEIIRLKEIIECLQSMVAIGDSTTERIRGLLRDVVVAADRMRDNWSESDQPSKQLLWVDLHSAASSAEDDVYPL